MLDGVGWSFVRAVHTSAEGAQHALRALALAPDEASAADAYWQLDNFLVVQGRLSEGAYRSIPFLLSCLHDRKRPSRHRTYELLIQYAYGRESVEQPTVRVGGIDVHLGDACRSAIASALPLLWDDTRDPDPKIRTAAIELIVPSHPDRTMLTPLFKELLAGESDAGTAETLRDWLTDLRESETLRQSFADWLDED